MRNRIEIVKNTEGKIQSGFIYAGESKRLAFNHKYDDLGLLREIEFEGQSKYLPTFPELYDLLNNQFIQVAEVMKLPQSTTTGETEVIDVRAVETIESRPLTSRNRTGRAFLVDTFENYTAVVTEKWLQSSGTIALDTAFPKTGKNCMSLTTGALAGNTAYAELNMGLVTGRLGLEFDYSINAPDDTKFYGPRLGIEFGDGMSVFDGLFWHRPASNLDKWYYFRTDGAYAALDFNTDVVPSASERLYTDAALQPFYHHVKMVIDTVSKKYVRLCSNNIVWELGDKRNLGLYSSASILDPYLKVTFGIETREAVAKVMRVDNVILTDQEP